MKLRSLSTWYFGVCVGDDTGKKITIPGKKIHVPWKKYLQPLEKKFRLLWSCGPLVLLLSYSHILESYLIRAHTQKRRATSSNNTVYSGKKGFRNGMTLEKKYVPWKGSGDLEKITTPGRTIGWE